MKNIKLLLLSSIFIAYGTQHVIAATATAPRSATPKFDADALKEEVDSTETSDAQQRDEELKALIAEKREQVKTLQAEIDAAVKEEKQASAAVGNEGAERLKRKILNHTENIKNIDEKIKQATAEHAAEIKRLNDEKTAQIKEFNDNHAIIIKDLNDQKALSAAKKNAREQELAKLKQQKSAPAPAATQGQAQAQDGQPAAKKQKVNAIVTSQLPAAPQQIAAKSGGLGGLFGGLEAIKAQVDQATDAVEKSANTVSDMQQGLSGAQASIAGLIPQSIKIESKGHSFKVINI